MNIRQTLDWCANDNDCAECDYYDIHNKRACIDYLMRDAAVQIRRLEESLEKLKRANTVCGEEDIDIGIEIVDGRLRISAHRELTQREREATALWLMELVFENGWCDVEYFQADFHIRHD